MILWSLGRTSIVDLNHGTMVVVLVAPNIYKGAVLEVYAGRVIEHDEDERRSAMHSIQLYSIRKYGNRIDHMPKKFGT